MAEAEVEALVAHLRVVGRLARRHGRDPVARPERVAQLLRAACACDKRARYRRLTRSAPGGTARALTGGAGAGARAGVGGRGRSLHRHLAGAVPGTRTNNALRTPSYGRSIDLVLLTFS